MALPPGSPDLASLDLLLSVVESGSLSRAAARHGITQPSASLRLRRLERQLGVRLLDRSPTGSSPTSEGSAVADWARPVLEAVEELVAGVTALRRKGPDRLRVAASMTVAEYLVPGWLLAMRATLPGTPVSLQVGNSDDVAAAVRGGAADLGFVEGPRAPTGLRSGVIGRDELVVVVAPAHPWARRRRPLTAVELARAPLVTREVGSGTRQVLGELLEAVHEPAPPALELASTTAIKTALETGGAPAVLSRLAVRAELGSGRLVEVPVLDLDLVRALRAVWRTGRAPTGAAGVLLAIARGAERQPSTRPSRARP